MASSTAATRPVFYIRRSVEEPEVFKESRAAQESGDDRASEEGADANSLAQIFRRDLLAFGAAAYSLCLIALLFLPETRGK